MRILCRTEASVEIGSGHVVRCATLAHSLAEAGHAVHFICRELPGNLNRWLEERGFQVSRLAAGAGRSISEASDARQCLLAVGDQRFDWILVDHYGLGAGWEQAMAELADRVFAIDDLGRPHHCNLLLDQNFTNPLQELYRQGSPVSCELLLGPTFALVRPEFATFRAKSVGRSRISIDRVLVFMGGSDPLNETCKALNGIYQANRSKLVVDVVIGAANPHRHAVEAACAGLQNATLHVQTSRMSELMAAADCAIGSAGSTTWERCVLGLPALVTILAENQAAIAEAVHVVGGHQLLGWHDAVTCEDYRCALSDLDAASLSRMSQCAAEICDGRGVERVVRRLTAQYASSNALSGYSNA
jgi:UDP-2,4-diacetamido-2,4,6-trideoxy-beta-L-altropyranose hydrolase